MSIVLVSKCSVDIEQYVEFKMSVLISPSKSVISSRWVTNVKVQEINNFGNNFLFIFFIYVKVQLPIWWLNMHKTENKSYRWRDEMSYGSDTWYRPYG